MALVLGGGGIVAGVASLDGEAEGRAVADNIEGHDNVLRRYIGEDLGEDLGQDDEVSAWWCTLDSAPEEEPPPAAVEAMQQEAEGTLHCAVYRQDQAAVDRILAAGADPDEPDYAGSGDTPLMQAVTSGHLGIVRSLCAAGCNVDASRVNGQSALMLCMVSRSTRRSPRLLLQLLEVLLAAGADPSVREKLRGQTALHALTKLVAADTASSSEPHLLTALRLLAERAQQHGVNAQDHRRRTALHHLASRGCANPEPFEILLEAKADPALQNARGDTALVEFLENVSEKAEHGEEVVCLLSGSDVARRHTQYGESPLHVAARRNRPGAVRIALATGADPGHQDLRGNTALHLAASRGYKEVVSLLLDAPGSPVNAVNRDGYTPLHVAVESGFVDVVNTLLGAEGVEVGPSALELAQQEYRFRAQPQLARTLASELDRRSSRTSLSLGLSSRPPSTCSFSTTASMSTPSATPQRSPSRRTLADDEEDRHPINFLGAQVSCTARIRPRYSANDLLAEGCLPPSGHEHKAPRTSVEDKQANRQLHQEQPLHQAHEVDRPVHQAHEVDRPVQQAHEVDRPVQQTHEVDRPVQQTHEVDRPVQQTHEDRSVHRFRPETVVESLREAAELMQKLCDEDLSVSPPADWSPPPARMRRSEPVWKPWNRSSQDSSAASTDSVRDLESLRDLRVSRPAELALESARTAAVSAAVEQPKIPTDQSRRSSTDSRRMSTMSTTESGRRSRRMSSESNKSKADQARKFLLPANPYATIRGCSLDDTDEDKSDYLVESLLAVAKSITEPVDGTEAEVQFDRTVEIPKDYDLFERSVLFGGVGMAEAGEGQGLGALRTRPVLSRSRASDTAIASR